jgi:hypothetical protein
MQDQSASRTCLACQISGADPPPSMTCRLGRDHRVGTAAGYPGCGRLMAACARRPCSAWQGARCERVKATRTAPGTRDQPGRERAE